MLTSCLNLIWPPRCIACDAGAGEPHFCAPCASSLVSGAAHACPVCAGVYLTPPVGGGDHTCGACLKTRPPFERARAAYAYGGALRDAMIRWKNRPDHTLSRAMCSLMLAGHRGRRWCDLEGDVIVVPIPSARAALLRRGFNPAGLLARALARERGWPLIHALKVRGHKGSSAGLNARQRERRLRGAFAVRSGRIRGATVVLVDDVMTTGATARAAARVCRRAGASSLQIALLSRVPLDA